MEEKDIKLLERMIGLEKIDESKIKDEKIAVELFYEKLIEFENPGYESEERMKITGEGMVLLNRIIDKVFRNGIECGKFLGKVEVIESMEKVIKAEKDYIPVNFIGLLSEGKESEEKDQ